MSDIVERLKYCAENGIMDASRAGMAAGYGEAAAEIEKLRRAMHEIYEVYAGSEWHFSATCSEAYLMERMMEMVAIAAEHKK